MPYFGYGYGYGGMYMGPGTWLVIIAILLSGVASMWVNSTFNKYSRVPSSKTGAQAARHVLDANGLYNVKVERVAGNLTDHYDPRTNTVRLSQSTYDSNSVGAVGVATHEVGHAIQYNKGYVPAKIRSAIVPAVSFADKLSIPLILFGLLLGMTGLVKIGIVLFAASFIFALVTLPVEFNASSRAIKTMKKDNYFSQADVDGSKKVLTAAGSTYLAGAFVSLAQLLRFMGMAQNNRRG